MAVIKWYLSTLLLLVLIISSVSGAISVHNVVITPSGDLISGMNPPEKVSGSLQIDFSPEGGLTFDSGEILRLSTDLDNATWDYTLVLDGNPGSPVTSTGQNFDISGWLLSYPSRRNVALSANFSGNVPKITVSGQKTILAVRVFSGINEVNAASDVVRVANVILPGSPLQTGTGGGQQTGGTVAPTTTVPTVPPTVPSAPAAPGSLAIPLNILALIVLLLAFIPLAFLVSHDHFALQRTTFPESFPVRAGIAIGHILCGIGLLSGILILQSAYAALAANGPGLNSVVLLLVLFFLSYFTLSAFVLATGSLISRAFHWTLRTHTIMGLVVLLTGPAALFLSSPPQGTAWTIMIVIIATIVSALLAVWQDRSTRSDLTEDWISRLSDMFNRMKTSASPHQTPGKNNDSAFAVLNLRLAKGEISLEEYNRLKEAIKK